MGTNLSAVVTDLHSYAVTRGRAPKPARASSRLTDVRRELATLIRQAQSLGAHDYVSELWDIAGRAPADLALGVRAVRRDLADSYEEWLNAANAS